MTKVMNLSAEQSKQKVWFCMATGFRLPVAKEKRGNYFLYNNKYLGDTQNDYHFLRSPAICNRKSGEVPNVAYPLDLAIQNLWLKASQIVAKAASKQILPSGRCPSADGQRVN